MLAGCLGLLVVAFAALAAKPITIKEVRLWAGPDGTRLVFDLSAPAEHDGAHARQSRSRGRRHSRRVMESERALPEGQGFVKQLRAAAQPNGDLRFVVDLSGPAQPKTFCVGPQQSYGHRLVMDLTPGKSSALAGPPSVVKAAGDAHGRDIVVAIDAGHGGVDPGSIGKRGTYEKHVTLAIARRLKERIDREPGMRAILTRDNDKFVEHRERIATRASSAGGHVRVRACGLVYESIGRRIVGVCAVRSRRERRIGALAGGSRKLGRPDRRRESGRQGQCAGVGAAGSVAEAPA